MKSIFESYVIFLSFIVFLMFGVSFVNIFYQMDQARMLHYFAISQIEGHHQLSQNVIELIESSNLCLECRVSYVREEGKRVLVQVEYPIHLDIVNLSFVGYLSSYTIPLG